MMGVNFAKLTLNPRPHFSISILNLHLIKETRRISHGHHAVPDYFLENYLGMLVQETKATLLHLQAMEICLE